MREGFPEVLYEDNHIIIVNKRSSDLVQGDGTGDESLDNIVRGYIKEKYSKPGDVFLGVVHRLDRPVSGCVVYARTSKALTRLSELFRTRDVKKSYWAIVTDRPPAEEGSLQNYLKKNEKQNKSYVYEKEVKGSKSAELSYKILSRSERYYLLEIDLHRQAPSDQGAAGCGGVPRQGRPEIRCQAFQRGWRHISSFQAGLFHSPGQE